MAAQATGYQTNWNTRLINKIVNMGPGTLNAVAQEVVGEAKKESPFKTGKNRRSIFHTLLSKTSAKIFTTSGYGGYLEVGTGLFGPHKKRITPVTKKALFWRGAAHPVASVAGMRAQPYIVPAMDKVKRNIYMILKKL